MNSKSFSNSRFSWHSLKLVDQVCEAFEEAWTGGSQPELEDYIARLPEDLRVIGLRHLLAIEIEYRMEQGHSIDTQRFVNRFPECGSYVQGLLKNLGDTQTRASALTEDWELVVPGSPGDPNPHVDQEENSENEPIPESIGPYRIIGVLGEGAFGRVFRAWDTSLGREVAIKGPGAKRWKRIQDALEKNLDANAVQRIVEEFLDEARRGAALKHPGLVTVYEFRVEEQRPYIVQELIEGMTLDAWVQSKQADYLELARIIIKIAEVLQYVHQQDFIHRDLKPTNIMVTPEGHLFVMDLGLSLHESVLLHRQGEFAGSPAYMSPEQISGESHRLDGRSDLWSLGVIFYELLVGRRPFVGNLEEVIFRIKSIDARPPRGKRPSVPPELERICLKLLGKRQSERYGSATDLIEDLQFWIGQAGSPVPPSPTHSSRSHSESLLTQAEPHVPSVRIIPRGLRSFDASDSEFFLDLLPGPRDRTGLPESLRFWKQRIESVDPEQTFSVGLLYGPSGCGKSSMVKAGLLPLLSKSVLPLYVEATAEETELRILKGLGNLFPGLSTDLGLVDSLAWIHQTQRSKVVIVIDQFEQWLHAHPGTDGAELIAALRQCDGVYVQGIVMIRDDFAMAAARLMDALDIPIVQGHNFATVDLFDMDHAEKVLRQFGFAYGKLPSLETAIGEEEGEFVRKVIEGLSDDGKVVSVRLSLFAEMVKGKPWIPETLAQIGGTSGVGVNFLDETFGGRSTNPKYRVHEAAAQRVLAALLPEAGSDIKGNMQSEKDLLEVSGYGAEPRRFDTLCEILDRELRLITPTERDTNSVHESSGDTKLCTRYYQLTHDYLVPSLREWLTRKQRETKRGRAELKLAERAATWNVNPENKQLPTLVEWFQIRRLTDPSKWKSGEKALMQRATRYHTTRTLMATTFVFALFLSGLGIKRWNDQQLMEREAASLVRTIETADFGKLADEFKILPALRAVIDPKLKAALEESAPGSDERLKLSLALVPSDPSQLDYLLARLQSAQASQVQVIIDQLRPYKDRILDSLWSAIEGETKTAWLPVASALADYDSGNERWRGVAAKVSDNLVRDPLRVSIWIELLRPAAMRLNPELKQIYAAEPGATRSQAQIDLATDVLETYAAADFPTLHELILSGRPEQFARMFDEYEAFRKEALAQLRDDVARTFVPDSDVSADEAEQLRLKWIARQANAAVALMRLEDPQPVYEFLTVERDPEALSQFIYRIRGREVSPSLLVKSFHELAKLPTPADPDQRRHSILRLYGMILGLGEFTVDQLPALERDGFIDKLSEMYGQHPSRTIHSSLGWLLRRWGQEERVRAIDERPLEYDPSGVREWYVVEVQPPVVEKSDDESTEAELADTPMIDLAAPIYFTMLVFPGDEFEMGEEGETEWVEISGPIAVSDREVTWRQFSPIDGDNHRQKWENDFRKDLGSSRRLLPEEPVFGVSWFDAVNYCRWLTEVRMPGEENQSYAKKELTPEQTRDPGWLVLSDPQEWEWPMDPKKPGFRLLTESEWKYVARGGMETLYSFGTSESLLGEYGWYDENSGGWSHATAVLRPTVAGLFDIHGNLWEWTNDWYKQGSDRVLRGGSWNFTAASCRTAIRNYGPPTYRSVSDGFRLALSPSGVSGLAEPAVVEAEPGGVGTEVAPAEPRPEMP